MATATAVSSQPAPPAGYTQLLNAIIRAPIRPGPKVLYSVLASYAWQSAKVTISQARLARECCVTERTIRRWTRYLEQEGWLHTYSVQGITSSYELLVPHHPGQRVRPVESEPRIEDSSHPGSDEEAGKDLSQDSPQPKEKNKGPRDPWAQLRTDPTVRQASKAGINRRALGVIPPGRRRL